MGNVKEPDSLRLLLSLNGLNPLKKQEIDRE
jgi:hypothetical protein